MKSTLENPLAFFEYVTQEQNFKKFVEDYIGNGDFLTFEIIDFKTIEYMKYGDYNEIIEGTTELKHFINPPLRREFKISLQLLYSFCITNKMTKNFLQIQFNIIQKIFNTNYILLNKYPHLTLALRGILKYINTNLNFSNTTFELNETKITTTSIGNEVIDISDRNLIHSIFDYMKGNNEKRELILNKDDFNLLIQYTIHLVEKKECPEIPQKININISSKQYILISYWVLHKKLYGTNKINDYFIDFIKSTFTNFKNTSIKTIKGKFGIRKWNDNLDILPEIVTNYLKE